MSDEKATLRLSERLRDRQHFTEIPNEMFFRNDISRQAKWLWICLCTFAWNTDEVWPSMETLEKLTGFSSRTVRKYKDELIDKGLLDQKRRGLGQTNLYRLNCPDKMENTPERKLLPLNPLNTSDQPPENFRSTPEQFPTNKDNENKDKDEEVKGEEATHANDEQQNDLNGLDWLLNLWAEQQPHDPSQQEKENQAKWAPQLLNNYERDELAEAVKGMNEMFKFSDEGWSLKKVDKNFTEARGAYNTDGDGGSDDEPVPSYMQKAN